MGALRLEGTSKSGPRVGRADASNQIEVKVVSPLKTERANPYSVFRVHIKPRLLEFPNREKHGIITCRGTTMSARQSDTRIWKKGAGPILIVDDDRDDAMLTKRAIESLRPFVPAVILQSGKELIEYLEAESNPLPALVLLDLRMPTMNGFEVLEWFKDRAAYSQVPIVAVSGLADSEHLKRAFALRVRSYLFKPINMTSLHDALSSLGVTY
jgi:two-component system response regulator